MVKKKGKIESSQRREIIWSGPGGCAECEHGASPTTEGLYWVEIVEKYRDLRYVSQAPGPNDSCIVT